MSPTGYGTKKQHTKKDDNVFIGIGFIRGIDVQRIITAVGSGFWETTTAGFVWGAAILWETTAVGF
jgi:hypothetical protein